jgi:hypothetical protein
MGFSHVLLGYSSTCFGLSGLCFLLKWLLLRDSRNSKLSLASEYAGGVEVAGAHCIWYCSIWYCTKRCLFVDLCISEIAHPAVPALRVAYLWTYASTKLRIQQYCANV